MCCCRTRIDTSIVIAPLRQHAGLQHLRRKDSRIGVEVPHQPFKIRAFALREQTRCRASRAAALPANPAPSPASNSLHDQLASPQPHRALCPEATGARKPSCDRCCRARRDSTARDIGVEMPQPLPALASATNAAGRPHSINRLRQVPAKILDELNFHAASCPAPAPSQASNAMHEPHSIEDCSSPCK